jgi:hypothetical protein
VFCAPRLHPRLRPAGTIAAACGAGIVIAAGVALLSFCNQPIALARGSQIVRDDPFEFGANRTSATRGSECVIRMREDHPPRAGHYFATYFENSRLIRLHFELLQRDGRATFCRSDSCLRQEYGLTGGRYRLMKNYYGRSTN